MIYLASPYSSPDPWVRHTRYLEAMKFTSRMLTKGIHIYSPIVHCHEMARCFDMPKDWGFWSEHDKHIIGISQEVWVLKLPGWEDSTGVKDEIAFARGLYKPVRFFYKDGTDEDS